MEVKKVPVVISPAHVYDLCGLTIQELACIKGAVERHNATGKALFYKIDEVERFLSVYGEYFKDR